jgi:signal transduction histidine kinase/ActR/RegA family two-component response regulator
VPTAIGLGALALVLAADTPPGYGLPVLAALVVLQGAVALAAGFEARRRMRRAAAEREAATGTARRAAIEEAERARARLLATTAHEIRTPLSGVVGLMEAVLAAPGLPRAAREDATAALEAARDLSLLLHDLVELPDGAPGPLASRPFRVDEAMEGVVTLLAARATAAGTRLATAVAPGTPPAWRGDPARLRQILVNLAANALRFTPRGEVRIEARETASGALELRVSDTGAGIPPERLERLFEPFAWSEGGSGLGLSICRDVARRMGGTIAVQSAPGRGSVFTVTLPLSRADPSEVPQPPPAPRSPLATPPPALAAPVGAPRPPVLVVDDVAVNRRLLGSVLERAGFRHEEAADGETALAMAAARPYSAVLMDLEMPGMDGLEATRRLRALPGPAATVPVVAVTAHGSAETEARARAAGMEFYLVKPVSTADVAEVLARAAAARAPAQP